MTPDLSNRVVLVTGGAGGIGRAAAVGFGAAGATVVVADLDAGGAGDTVDLITEAGGTASSQSVDLADETQVEALIGGIVEAEGRLDAAFNNAGISAAMGSFHQLDKDGWDRMIAVNLTSVFLCMKHELTHFVERGGGGAIVNTASGAAIHAAPGQPHYTAAKAGVLGLTRSAASEYARQGIRVNAVLPGVVDTPMTQGFIGGDENIAQLLRSSSVTGEMLDPSDIGDVAVWLCSDSARQINGQSIVIDGGGLFSR